MGSFSFYIYFSQWQPRRSHIYLAVGSVGSQVCQEGIFSPAGFFKGPEVSVAEMNTWVPRAQLSYRSEERRVGKECG